MKQHFYFALLAAALLTAGQSPAKTTFRLSSGELTREAVPDTPEREILYLEDGLIVTHHFSEAALRQASPSDDRPIWKTRGFQTITGDGLPALPAASDVFYIGRNYEVEVELIGQDYQDYHVLLAAAPTAVTESRTQDPVPDRAISPYEGFFPACPVGSPEIQYWRDKALIYVSIWPAQYDMENETVRANTSLSYRIRYRATGPDIQSVEEESGNPYLAFPFAELATPLINPEKKRMAPSAAAALPAYPAFPNTGYLILTTPKFHAAAEKFAEWKRVMGFTTIVEERSNWTSETIKAFVRQKYNDDNIRYMLILGNHADVPTHAHRFAVIYSGSETMYTDYPYACMDGDDDCIPEIYIGRIPANTLSEANVAVNKIISYQRNPVRDASFYETALHCAQFQDGDTKSNYKADTYEDTRFTKTSEEILAYISGNFSKTVKRVYTRTSDTAPMLTEKNRPRFYNNDKFSYGEPLEAPLSNSGFDWSGNANQVANAINAGCHYVFYRGHGSEDRYNAMNFGTENLSQLTNTSRLPVFFNITCSTGNFHQTEKKCMARELLVYPNGGAVAVIAATYPSYSGHNDALAESLFSSLFGGPLLIPDMPGFPTTLQSVPTSGILGIALQSGFMASDKVSTTSLALLFNKTTRELFHIFGDPSMSLYTINPYRTSTSPSVTTLVNFLTSGIAISGSHGGMIGIYDTKTGSVQTAFGDGTHTAVNPTYCVVSIMEENRPVKVFKGPDAKLNYIQ